MKFNGAVHTVNEHLSCCAIWLLFSAVATSMQLHRQLSCGSKSYYQCQTTPSQCSRSDLPLHNLYTPRLRPHSSYPCSHTSDSRIIPKAIHIISAGRMGSFLVSRFRNEHKNTVVTHCRLVVLHSLWLVGDQYRNCSTRLLVLALHGMMKSVLSRGQSPKWLSRRVRRRSGTTATESSEHFLKASFPISVTLLGIVTAVSPVHS